MNNSLNEGWDLFSGISRNFCLASRFLPKDTRDTNMTLYLMLKMADTIEDSNLPIEVKKECFDMYREFLLLKKIFNGLYQDLKKRQISHLMRKN